MKSKFSPKYVYKKRNDELWGDVIYSPELIGATSQGTG